MKAAQQGAEVRPEVISPQSGRFWLGWRQVVATMLIMACTGIIPTTYGIIAGPIAREFQPSRMVLMLAITALSISTALLSPLIGSLMDRSSLRRIMAMGVGGMVLGYAALSLVTSFGQVLLIFATFMGAAQAMAGPVGGTVLLARWFEKRRGTALGIAISGIGAGTMIFPLLIQALLDNLAWRDALRALAAILAVLTLPAAALIINRPQDRGVNADGAEMVTRADDKGATPADASSREILRHSGFWFLSLVVTVVLAGMIGAVTNVVAMARDYGAAGSAAAFVVSAYAASSFIAKLSFAAIADRLRTDLLIHVVLVIFGTGMAALATGAQSYWAILLGAVLVGFGGMMVPLQSLVISRMFGTGSVGRAAGFLSLVSLCALLVTPPLFGWVFDETGSYSAIFWTYGALTWGAMLLVPSIGLRPRAP